MDGRKSCKESLQWQRRKALFGEVTGPEKKMPDWEWQYTVVEKAGKKRFLTADIEFPNLMSPKSAAFMAARLGADFIDGEFLLSTKHHDFEVDGAVSSMLIKAKGEERMKQIAEMGAAAVKEIQDGSGLEKSMRGVETVI